MGLFGAQSDECDCGKSEEDPCGKNEERIELLEGSGERQQSGYCAQKNQGATWSVKARMNASREFEENAVTSHGERNARTRQDDDMQGAEGGDSHCQGQRSSSTGASEGLDDIRSDVLRGGDRSERQGTKVDEVRHEVKADDGEKSENDGARDIFLRFENLFAEIAEVIEAVVGPHGGHERGENGTNRCEKRSMSGDRACRGRGKKLMVCAKNKPADND